MSEKEIVFWKDGTLGTGSTLTVLGTANELPSITWTFEPPLQNVTALNFSGLTGRWDKQGSNRSQIRVRVLDSSGVTVWSMSGSHITGSRTTSAAFNGVAKTLAGVEVATIFMSRQRSRATKFSAVTTVQPSTASFFFTHVPTDPSIESVVSLSSSMIINIKNPSDGLILSVGDSEFEVDGDSDSVVIKDLEPSTNYNVTLKR